jgi:hypothetical protein
VPIAPDAKVVALGGYSAASADDPRPESTDCAAGQNQGLLEGVVRISHGWMERIPVDDPQREKVARVGSLAADLIRTGDFSSAAMTTARALMCVNCRRLNAAQGKCFGQALDRCLLLNGVA